MMPASRFLIALLACFAALHPGEAAAHAILMDSQPADGATTPPGNAALTLRFNSRIDAARSRIALRNGQNEVVLPLQISEAGDGLAARTVLAPGAYVIRWQVLAIDGHITRGDVRFKVGDR